MLLTTARAVVQVQEILVPGAVLQYRDKLGRPLRTLADATVQADYEVLWDISCLRMPGCQGDLQPPLLTTLDSTSQPRTQRLSWDEGRELDRAMADFADDYAPGQPEMASAASAGDEEDQGGDDPAQEGLRQGEWFAADIRDNRSSRVQVLTVYPFGHLDTPLPPDMDQSIGCDASHGRRVKLDAKHAMSRIMDELSKSHGSFGYFCSRLVPTILDRLIAISGSCQGGGGTSMSDPDISTTLTLLQAQ